MKEFLNFVVISGRSPRVLLKEFRERFGVIRPENPEEVFEEASAK